MLCNRRKFNLIALIFCFILIFGVVSFAAYEPFKVKLTLFERIVVISLLPAEGSYVTLKIVRDLQDELAANEEEIALSGLKDSPGGGVEADDWNIVPEKEIILGEKAKEIIVNVLKKLDEQEKLGFQHFAVYEKFVIGVKKEGE